MMKTAGKGFVGKPQFSRMKRALFIAFFLVLLSSGLNRLDAAVYYVDAAGGSDSNPGLTKERPWKTIARINRAAENSEFKDNDVIRLKRGSVWSKDECLGHPVNRGEGKGWISWGPLNGLVVTDYGTGKKPRLDGNTQRPVYIRDRRLKNLVIQNIDISGSDWRDEKGSNLLVVDVNGVTLEGIEGDGYLYGKKNAGKTAITVSKCKGMVEIKKCRLQNWGHKPVLTLGKDFMGIAVLYIEEGRILIHHNQVSNTVDSLHYFKNKAQAKVFDNVLFNGAENAIDCKSSSNVEIFKNRMYREKTFTGTGGSGGGSLLGIHDNAGFIAGPSRIIIHNNHFGPSDKNYINVNGLDDVDIYQNVFENPERVKSGTGIRLKNTKGTKIHHNRFSDLYGNILIKTAVQNLLIYYNIILNPNSVPSEKGLDRGGIYEMNGAKPPTRIYNNTICNVEGTCSALINIPQSYGGEIRNNIGYQNSLDNKGLVLWVGDPKKPLSISNNCWFTSGNGTIAVQKGQYYLQTHEKIWARQHPGDLFTDPLFVDAEAGDLRLQAASPCIDTAKNLGPTFQLSRNPDSVGVIANQGFESRVMLNQSLMGKGWDMGAFCFIPNKEKN